MSQAAAALPWLAPLSAGALAAARAQYAAHGLAVLDPCLTEDALRAMIAEAEDARLAAWVCQHAFEPGKSIDQRALRAEFGPLAKALLESEALGALLAAVSGGPLEVCYRSSSYTYYETPGDFCGAHVDRSGKPTVTFILGLDARALGERSGGMELRAYPGSPDRRSRTSPMLRVSTHVTRAVIVWGSEVVHERLPIGPGERIAVLSCCFIPPGSPP